MKAYVLEGINQLVYKDITLRPIEPGEALVEVHAAGICGSDIPRIFETGTYHFPTIPGHEFSGKVIKVADAENQEWVGKRVAIFPLIPCMECPSCKKRQYEMCSHYNYLGSRCNGGFAEQVIVPIWNLMEISDDIAYEEAAMFEPTAVALHAVRRLEGFDQPIQSALKEKTTENACGEHFTNSAEGVSEMKVLLMGLGTIGGLIAQWLSVYGVKAVTATGHHPEQEALMHQTASEGYVYINTKGWKNLREQEIFCDKKDSYDVIIDCVGNSESLSDALDLVRQGGQILEVGNPHGNVEVEKALYWKLLRKQIRMTGTWNSSFDHDEKDDWETVKKCMESGQLKLEPMMTQKLGFEELEKGLEIMRGKKAFYSKVMISK